MSRVAKWRRGPGDPETARGWLFRGERSLESSRPIDRRRLFLMLSFLARWLSIGALLLFVVPKGRHYVPFINVVWPFFTIWSNRKPKRVSSENPPELEESFEVTLAVCSDQGLGTGRDRGLLIFCDGWLLFEGRRTEFAVTRGEATGRLESSILRLKLEDGRTAVLAATQGTDTEALKRAYYVWRATTPPDGEALLPPTEVHPEIWATLWTFGLLGTGIFAAPATLGAFCSLWIVTIPMALGFIACSGATAFFACRLRQELPRVLPNAAPASIEPREAQTASIH